MEIKDREFFIQDISLDLLNLEGREGLLTLKLSKDRTLKFKHKILLTHEVPEKVEETAILDTPPVFKSYVMGVEHL